MHPDTMCTFYLSGSDGKTRCSGVPGCKEETRILGENIKPYLHSILYSVYKLEP